MFLSFLVKLSFLVGKLYGCNIHNLANTVFSNIYFQCSVIYFQLQKKKNSGNNLLAQSINKSLIIFFEWTSRNGVSGLESLHICNIFINLGLFDSLSHLTIIWITIPNFTIQQHHSVMLNMGFFFKSNICRHQKAELKIEIKNYSNMWI